jgi:hypothetical protein
LFLRAGEGFRNRHLPRAAKSRAPPCSPPVSRTPTPTWRYTAQRSATSRWATGGNERAEVARQCRPVLHAVALPQGSR